MIEVVFSESAGGSLKIAQGFGRGAYPGGCTSVFLCREDGGEASPEEIRREVERIEERQRREWEEAQPIGGSAGDVFEFSLALSYGDISEENFWENRAKALRALSPWPGAEQWVCSAVDRARERLAILLRRAEGEGVRIWYSSHPDEICGMHWMLTQLHGRCGDVRLVQLPDREAEGDVLHRHSGWGEISPEHWSRYLKSEEAAAPVLRRSCVARWRELEAENAPLRALLSGELASLPETAYDHFIRREIAAQAGEFRQARLIGSIIGKYNFGFGDGFIALRMEEMISSGELEIVREAGEGEPSYRRILRKCGKNC